MINNYLTPPAVTPWVRPMPNTAPNPFTFKLQPPTNIPPGWGFAPPKRAVVAPPSISNVSTGGGLPPTPTDTMTDDEGSDATAAPKINKALKALGIASNVGTAISVAKGLGIIKTGVGVKAGLAATGGAVKAGLVAIGPVGWAALAAGALFGLSRKKKKKKKKKAKAAAAARAAAAAPPITDQEPQPWDGVGIPGGARPMGFEGRYGNSLR